MNWFPQNPNRARTRLAPLLFVAALLAAVTLAACGSSSSGSTKTASSASSTPNGAGAAGGNSKVASLRACLAKQGITLPKRPAGAGPGPGNGLPGSGLPGGGAPGAGAPGGGAPPSGVNREKLQAAIKKCGGTGFTGRRPGRGSAASRESLTKFAACMRANGVNLPEPNTSGNGPVFNTNGIDTTSQTFTNARQKCQSTLKGAYGGPPPNGAAPAG